MAMQHNHMSRKTMMQFEVSFSTRTATAQEVRLHGQPLHSQYLVVVKLLYLWKKRNPNYHA